MSIREGKGTLKVVLFTTFVAPYYRPVLQHLSKALDGLKIFVSTPMDPSREWDRGWDGLSVIVQKCFSYATWYPYRRSYSEKALRYVPYDTSWLLIRHRPDVVISLQLGIRTMQTVLYRKLFPNSRLILWLGMSEHTEKGLPAWRLVQRKALLRVADAVLVTGTSGKNYLLGLGVRREKIFLHSYYPEIRPQLDLPIERGVESQRRLLYVGRLITLKGLNPFLATLSTWLQEHPGRSCELWIAGDGPIRAELQSIPTAPQLRVSFLGNVAYQELAPLYGQCGIFVFPTLADEWGIVVNEALAAGLPVLGSVYGQAVDDIVRNDINGWTFRPDHPEEIYASIDRAMNAPDEQLTRMRHAARRTALGFMPDVGAKSILDAIDFALSSSGEESAFANSGPANAGPGARGNP